MIYKFEQVNLSPKLDSNDWDGKMEYALKETFFIANYSDTATIDRKIARFVNKNKVKSSPSPMLYQISFYKVSPTTNKQNLAINSEDFEKYTKKNDLVWVYEWVSGKFINKEKYRNGRKIENLEIDLGSGFKMKMLPDSTQ